MIYILEDDDTIRKLVIYALKSQAYEAQGFSCPSAFWPAVEASLPSLILLDLMLPEEDGISILNRLRSHQLTRHIPVIILTAKSSELDRVEGLDAGADDYVIKPFSILELLARVRAVLRRSEQGSQEEKDLRIGDMIISVQKHEVSVNGRLVALTQKEFSLLYLLASHEGSAMRRSELLDQVWQLGNEPENRTLDVHIRTLRQKLGKAGDYIETVRGIGYRFKASL